MDVPDLLYRLGPFLIPVALFALGVVGYGLLYLYTRRRAGAGKD